MLPRRKQLEIALHELMTRAYGDVSDTDRLAVLEQERDAILLHLQ